MTSIDFQELKNGQLVKLYSETYIVLGEGPYYTKNAYCVKTHRTYRITEQNAFAFSLVRYPAE